MDINICRDQLIIIKTQITTNTRALVYHRLYGSVTERIKHMASNMLSYRETSSDPIRSSFPKSLFTVDCAECLYTIDCTKSLYIVEKQALKLSTPQKSLHIVEKSVKNIKHCRKNFTLTALNKNKQKFGKNDF